MGTVLWAWHEATQRSKGEWAVSTRLQVERGSEVEALVTEAGGEWGSGRSVTACASGTEMAWICAYARWDAPGRVQDRKRWAAWTARAGGERGWKRRYEAAVARGEHPVSEEHKERWEQRCRQSGEEIVRARRDEGGDLIRTEKSYEGVVCRATGTGKEERGRAPKHCSSS